MNLIGFGFRCCFGADFGFLGFWARVVCSDLLVIWFGLDCGIADFVFMRCCNIRFLAFSCGLMLSVWGVGFVWWLI